MVTPLNELIYRTLALAAVALAATFGPVLAIQMMVAFSR